MFDKDLRGAILELAVNRGESGFQNLRAHEHEAGPPLPGLADRGQHLGLDPLAFAQREPRVQKPGGDAPRQQRVARRNRRVDRVAQEDSRPRPAPPPSPDDRPPPRPSRPGKP
nr:hypothetical protein [Rhodobacter capsulatus]